MSTRTSPSLLELFSETPAQTTLLTLVPALLAMGQLANGLLTDASLLATVGFALAMVAFSVVATGHHAATRRLRRLEAELPVESDRR